jgi:hypothetical protein
VAVALGSVLSIAACGSWWGPPDTAQDLGDRLQARLAPDIAAGRVALDRLPDGARVTLADQTLFASGGTALGGAGQTVLTGVIQGLIDPSLLRIAITDSAAAQGDGQGAQTQAVTQYFDEYGLGRTLQPPGTGDASPQGLAITIRIVSS